MHKEEAWNKAQQLCRLSVEDVRMARELGMSPRGLMKNIATPSQRWKAPVKVWIRELYEKRFARRRQSLVPRASPTVNTTGLPPGEFDDSEIPS